MVSTLAPASSASALAPRDPPPLVASALVLRDDPPTLARGTYVSFFSFASFLFPFTPVFLPPQLLVGRDHISCHCGRGRTDVAGVLYGRAHGRRGCGHVRGHGRPRPWPWF